LIGLNLSSCKKLIEIDLPKTSVVTGKVFNSNADVEAALAGVYSSMGSSTGVMNGTNGGITLYAGQSADELGFSLVTSAPSIYSYESNKLFADSANTVLFWSPAYKTIFSINAILEGVSSNTSTGLTDSLRRQTTAECKFLRAFNYFYLVNLFGDVPLVLSTDFNKTGKLPRTAKNEVYEQIVQDLLDAKESLPKDYAFVPSSERVRVNRPAATAMLARVYLYLERWQDAADAATELIGDSQFELLTDLRQVFLKK
jgi:hypothetical protein